MFADPRILLSILGLVAMFVFATSNTGGVIIAWVMENSRSHPNRRIGVCLTGLVIWMAVTYLLLR